MVGRTALRFGLVSWVVSLDNLAPCALDEIAGVERYGGAGVHFMFVRGRYRASFNFLEYPRMVIAFKSRVGPVRDISFSTRRPDEVLRLLQAAALAARTCGSLAPELVQDRV